MPVIHGTLGDAGPIVDILVGVNETRRKLLEKHAFPIPAPVNVRALLDTGSGVTGLDTSIFGKLDLTPLGTMEILTPSTGATSHECDRYRVSLSLAGRDV